MKHIVSRMSSYFPNRWPLSYLNLTKNMKTHIRRQQHKNLKHQDIKQKEPPQKYRLGTISNTKLLAGLNRFYMAITSPSASAVIIILNCSLINCLIIIIDCVRHPNKYCHCPITGQVWQNIDNDHSFVID